MVGNWEVLGWSGGCRRESVDWMGVPGSKEWVQGWAEKDRKRASEVERKVTERSHKGCVVGIACEGSSGVGRRRWGWLVVGGVSQRRSRAGHADWEERQNGM